VFAPLKLKLTTEPKQTVLLVAVMVGELFTCMVETAGVVVFEIQPEALVPNTE
jgi:hypothetical protein